MPQISPLQFMQSVIFVLSSQSVEKRPCPDRSLSKTKRFALGRLVITPIWFAHYIDRPFFAKRLRVVQNYSQLSSYVNFPWYFIKVFLHRSDSGKTTFANVINRLFFKEVPIGTLSRPTPFPWKNTLSTRENWPWKRSCRTLLFIAFFAQNSPPVQSGTFTQGTRESRCTIRIYLKFRVVIWKERGASGPALTVILFGTEGWTKPDKMPVPRSGKPGVTETGSNPTDQPSRQLIALRRVSLD